MDAQGSTSTRPYLIRALYEWCADNGLTPYLAVQVDDTVQVPREYVKDGEIVLNVSVDATSGLQITNDMVAFSARFAGKAREIMIPMDRVIAIYARENGQGMAFPRPVVGTGPAATGIGKAPAASESPKDATGPTEADVKLVDSGPSRLGPAGDKPTPVPSGPKKRPKLTRIK
ncbi:MAG: ClpXP protease specificity-enhancing factor [Burkholderiaceae bacterium]